MSQFVEQRSARAALVSSGIVASVTALMMKGLNQPLKVSLPLGVATAIGLDYWNNKREATDSLRDGITEYRKLAHKILQGYEAEDLSNALPGEQQTIRDRYDGEREKIRDGVPEPDAYYVNQALTGGWLTLSWLGYMAIVGLSELVWVRPISQHSQPARVVARLGATVVAAEASVWAPLIVGYLRNDLENLGTVVREGVQTAFDTLGSAVLADTEEVVTRVMTGVARYIQDEVMTRVSGMGARYERDDRTAPWRDGFAPDYTPDLPRAEMTLVDLDLGDHQFNRFALNYGPRQPNDASPVVSVPVVEVQANELEDMVSLLDFHPNIDAVGTGNGAFADGSVGVDDLNLDQIRDAFSWPSVGQQLVPSDVTQSLTTLTQMSPSQYGMSFDQWNYLEAMSDFLPYWEDQGFQNEALGYRVVNGYLALGEEQQQPPSQQTGTTESSDESFEWSLAYMILRRRVRSAF